MKTKVLYISLLFSTAMIWGFAFVAQVEGAEHIGPFTLTGVRFLISIVALLPVVFAFEGKKSDPKERKRTLVASLLSGGVLFTASMLQQFGIQITSSAGVSGFITGLYTVLVPIACFIFFKQKTGLNVVLGAVCAIVGLFLLCYKAGEGFSVGIGEGLLLIGAFFWTAHVIIVDRLGKNIRSLHFAWGQFAVCAVLGIIGMFIFEAPTVESVMSAKWSLLYCGVFSSGVAYTLQIVAQKRANPTFAAIVLSTEAVFSAIGGAIFGIDSISLLGYSGCAIIFFGIVVSQLNFGKTKTPTILDDKMLN